MDIFICVLWEIGAFIIENSVRNKQNYVGEEIKSSSDTLSYETGNVSLK